MVLTDFLYSIIIVLLGGIGYFVKRIFDRTDSIGSIERDMGDIKPKVKVLWDREFANGASPLTPNEHGRKILAESGIKELVDAQINQLLKKLHDEKPQNAYQIQEAAAKVIRVFIKDPQVLSRLQEGAFKTGVDVDVVLFVGGLYLRDLALLRYDF